jgi:hypothetical protein
MRSGVQRGLTGITPESQLQENAAIWLTPWNLPDRRFCLEGRRSFQLSYGRSIDSKRFRAFATSHLLPFVSNGLNHAILRQFLVATLPQELTALLGWFHTPELSLKTP